MNTSELLLIDLSGLAHQIWPVSGNEPDPSFVSTQLIARVRALAANHAAAAVCCDSGKSFRCDIDPTYKAHRDTENRAPLKHQMAVACDTLRADGFPIWSVDGFEADDLIASATREALAIPDTTVLIASADKDLLQLVNDRVSAKNITTGNVLAPSDVAAKFGVQPTQMLDYLCLVGDASDNVKGAESIGPVTAAAILKKFGTLTAFYAKLDSAELPPDMKRRAKFLAEEFGISDKQRASLIEFSQRWSTVRSLIALRDDVPIPFAEIAVERQAKPMVETANMSDAQELSAADATNALGAVAAQVRERIAQNNLQPERNPTDTAAHASAAPGPSGFSPSVPNGGVSGASPKAVAAASTDIVQAPPPVEWELQLEPRSYRDVRVFSDDMHLSRKFIRNFGSSQAIAATIVSGRELGVPAMASLRSFYSVEDGPPMPHADLVRGLILKSGKVEYFEPTERSDKAAEFAIKRHGRGEIKLRYTIEEGRTAYGFDAPMTEKERVDLERKWQRSGWGKNPADMVSARASMKLGRLVCPDVCAGLYAPEEFD